MGLTVHYGIDRYMNVAMASNAVWLADGESIAYLTNITGVPQVWRVGAEGGYPEQITYFRDRIWFAYTLKASLGVAFTMDTGGDENNQIYLARLDGSAARNLTLDPTSVHHYGGIVEETNTLVFSSNARDKAHFDIRLMDLGSGEQRILVENNDHYNIPAALSPDGRYLLYNKMKGPSDNALWMVHLATGEARQVPSDGGENDFTGPVWRSDGAGFYLLTEKDSEFIYAAWYSLANDKMEVVHKEKWDVEGLALSHDDRYLAILVNEDGYSALKVKDLTTGALVDLPEIPRGVISHYSTIGWSPKEHKLAFSLTSSGRTPDIWVLDLPANEILQVTHSSTCGIREDGFTEPELIRFESFDGLEVPAWLFRPKSGRGSAPKDDRGLLPILVNIHGGPAGQERPAFNPLVQFLVNQGLAVVAPNVRGSTGYGSRYHHLDDVEKRMDSVKDIEALVKHLVDARIAHPGRIAVMGASYGGFMTLSSITEYPELWAAAVDVVGIANFETFLENTSSYRRAHREAEYGTLAKDRHILRAVSPIHKIDQIKCPLMLVHGVNDPRVPFSEAEQIAEKLRGLGREVKFLRYEDEGHGIVKLANKLDCHPQVAEFLKKHLRVD